MRRHLYFKNNQCYFETPPISVWIILKSIFDIPRFRLALEYFILVFSITLLNVNALYFVRGVFFFFPSRLFVGESFGFQFVLTTPLLSPPVVPPHDQHRVHHLRLFIELLIYYYTHCTVRT